MGSVGDPLPEWLRPPRPPESPEDKQLRLAIEELTLRQQGTAHVAEYARQVVEVDPALHHRLICTTIEEGILGDLWDDLLITMPPGSAKSTYVSHVFPAWYMGRFPKHNMIIASHTASLAEKWSRKVRDTVASPNHVRLFPESTLSKDSTAVTRWATSQGGECLAAGAGMSILGFRANILVCDDLVSGWEQAQSITQLTKLQDWFNSDLKSRMKPNAKRIIVNQRLSSNDIAGYIMQQFEENPTRRLKVVNLPMIAESDDDPLGRKIGDLLWPEWFTEAMVKDLQKDDLIWRTMWQQHPPSEDGSWVSPDEIKIVDLVPAADRLKHYLLSDLALSVNTGDYSVHITVGVDDDLNVFVLDAWRARVSPEVTVEKHLALARDYLPQESLIDDDNAAKVYVQLLSQMARSSKINVPWKMLPMRGQDKETRAAPLRGWFKRGKIFLKRGEWNRWMVKELLAFPNAMGEGVDDGVDALGLIGRRLGSLSRAASVIPDGPPPDPRGTFFSATFDQLWETLPKMNRRI